MTQYGNTWLSYGGSARLVLALAVLAVAVALACAGTRFHRPVRLPRPGRALTAGMLAAWVVSIGAFFGGLAVYALQVQHDHLEKPAAANPIQFVTFTAALILFLIVFAATDRSLRVRM